MKPFAVFAQTEANSDYFQINTGIHERFLFNLTLWLAWERWQRNCESDAIALLAATLQYLNELSGALEHKALKTRLQISASKSKILCVGFASGHNPVLVGQQPLEEVNYFTYLGRIIDP